MSIIRHVLLFCLLLTVSLLPGCGGSGNDSNTPSTAVVFSDIHFNPYYDPSLFPALVAADPKDWAGIFQSSTITTPSAWGSDTNYPLLTIALSSLRDQARNGSIAIFNGDLLGHDFPQLFFKLSGTEDEAAMKAFADKTVAFVMEQIRAAVGELPVMFAVGNGDSYTGYGPDSSFLSNTAELYYSYFLRGTVDHNAFLNSFTRGGYYAAELPGTNLTVIGLNTILLSPLFPGDNDALVNAQFSWLDSTLASAKASGKSVWLAMHVPPGGDLGSTAKEIDSSGRLTAATMMWRPDYQATFLNILSKYPGIVRTSFGGHTHMDEFRIIAGNVLHISPGISPVFGNNPAYKTVTFSSESFDAIDYTDYRYDLAAPASQFANYYSFASTYLTQGLLDPASEELNSELPDNSTSREQYRTAYYGGTTPGNPITDLNWPVYWCGIGNMNQQALIDCVNSYGTDKAKN